MIGWLVAGLVVLVGSAWSGVAGCGGGACDSWCTGCGESADSGAVEVKMWLLPVLLHGEAGLAALCHSSSWGDQDERKAAE